MNKRTLGQSGIEIAPLMLGGNVFGWTIDEATSFDVLDAFAGAGLNAIDTADCYMRWMPGGQGGESETIIGKWMKARKNRDAMVIATKVGLDMGDFGMGLNRAHIMRSIDASLQRLGTDYVDLYQAHEDDPNTPLEETLSAFQELINAGKVRAVGVSKYDPQRLAAWIRISEETKTARCDTLQPYYNLYKRLPFEADYAGVCKDHKVSVIPYFGLESGFLTGKYRNEADLTKSPRGQGMKDHLGPRGMAILAALDSVGARLNATPAQVALAWLMAQPTIAAPIASATSAAQLQDIAKSVHLKLDADALKTLGDASQE